MTFVNRENSVVVLKELIFEWTTSWESKQDLHYFKFGNWCLCAFTKVCVCVHVPMCEF